MKKIKLFALAYIASALAFGGTAWARRADITHEAIVVAKGETRNGDAATDKAVLIDGAFFGNLTSVGGGTVTVNGELTGDLVSMGGPILITGRVTGDVSAIGGPVTVDGGRVTGELSAVGGRITLAGTARVDGDIYSLSGVTKGPDAVHKGEVLSMAPDGIKGPLSRALSKFRGFDLKSNKPRWERRDWSFRMDGADSSDLKTFGWIAAAAIAAFLLAALGGVLLIVLPAVFFPEQVQRVRAAMLADLWKACAVGALILICFFPGLLLMTVSILGIPLVPFALLLAAAASLVGLTAFCLLVQARFFEGLKRPGPASLPAQAAAGAGLIAALIVLGKLIPLLGGVIALAGMMLLAFGVMTGLGAAWLTRLGTRPFAAAPLPAAAPAQQPAAAAQPAAQPPAQQ